MKTTFPPERRRYTPCSRRLNNRLLNTDPSPFCWFVITFLLQNLCGIVPTASAQNMLANGGLEDPYSGGVAQSWTPVYWGAVGVTCSKTTTNVYAGAAAQNINVTSLTPGAGGIDFVQNFSAQAGKVYEAKVWLRTNGGWTKVHYNLRQPTSSYIAGASAVMWIGPTWGLATIRGGFQRTAQAQFTIAFYGASELVVDQASVTDITASALTEPPAFPTIPVSSQLFGIHLNKLGTHNVWPALNQGVNRLWGTNTTWSLIQPSPGVWDWARLDYLVNHSWGNNPNCKIIYTLGMTPYWKAVRPSEDWYGAGSMSPPTDLWDPSANNSWRQYVRAVALRYPGKIKYFEIWNEANWNLFYTGTIAEMVELTRIAHTELKAIDPTIVVLSPNITTYGLPWIEEFLGAGGGQYCDVISYHSYTENRPEYEIGVIKGLKDLLSRWPAVSAKPIWNTEGSQHVDVVGVPINGNDTRGLVSRGYILHWAYGIENFNWYTWDMHYYPWAYLCVDNGSYNLMEPGGEGYANTSSWLIGSKMTAKSIDGNGVWIVTLQQSDGNNAYIVWRPDGPVTFTIPTGWNITGMRDLVGSTTDPLTSVGATVGVGVNPILLVSGGAPPSGSGQVIGSAAWGSGGTARIDAFVMGTDRSLWWKNSVNGGASWNSYVAVGVSSNNGISVTDRGAALREIFYSGSDGSLRTKRYNGSWLAEHNLGGTIVGGPAATSWSSASRIDVFVRGGGNALYWIYCSAPAAWPAPWSSYSQVPGATIASSPAVSHRGTGYLDVFYAGTDGSLRHKAYASSAWAAEVNLGGTITGSPSAAAWGTGTSARIDVFARGGGNTLWMRTKVGTGAFGAWTQVPGASIYSDPSASARGTGLLEVLYKGSNGALKQIRYSGSWGAEIDLGGGIY